MMLRKPAQGRPTLAAVAWVARVSTATLSKLLNGRTSRPSLTLGCSGAAGFQIRPTPYSARTATPLYGTRLQGHATIGLVVAAGAALLLAQATGSALRGRPAARTPAARRRRRDGLRLRVDLGDGGIPQQHGGVAGGFLMTSHEAGAALGGAVLSAPVTSAGSLTTLAGIVGGYSRGFTGAAAIAIGFAVIAYRRMPPNVV